MNCNFCHPHDATKAHGGIHQVPARASESPTTSGRPARSWRYSTRIFEGSTVNAKAECDACGAKAPLQQIRYGMRPEGGFWTFALCKTCSDKQPPLETEEDPTSRARADLELERELTGYTRQEVLDQVRRARGL